MDLWRNRPNAPPPGTIIGPLAEVGLGGKEYVFGRGLGAFRLFAVRHAGGAKAYVNKCSHYSLPLNHRPDEFLTNDGGRIMCRQHLALFAIADGACVGGACEGEGLQQIPLRIDRGLMVVD